PCFTDIPQTGSPLATMTDSHRASQDFPTLGEPARMCSPCDSSVSTTKLSGVSGRLIRLSPSMVCSRFVLLIRIISLYKDKDRDHAHTVALVLSLDYWGDFDKMRISQDRPKTDIGQRRWPYATGDQAEQQFPAPDNGCLAGSDLFQRDPLPGRPLCLRTVECSRGDHT